MKNGGAITLSSMCQSRPCRHFLKTAVCDVLRENCISLTLVEVLMLRVM